MFPKLRKCISELYDPQASLITRKAQLTSIEHTFNQIMQILIDSLHDDERSETIMQLSPGFDPWKTV